MNPFVTNYSFNTSEWSKNFRIIFILVIMLLGFFIINKFSNSISGLFTQTKAEVVQQNKQLKQDIKEIQKASDIIAQNKEDVKKSTEDLLKTNFNDKTKTEEIKVKKEKKAQEIINKPELSPEEKDKKLAETEIDMLWENFCQIDTTGCKEKQNG